MKGLLEKKIEQGRQAQNLMDLLKELETFLWDCNKYEANKLANRIHEVLEGE